MVQVQNGSRFLQFEGELLAESTSWNPGSTRWVEFKLYRTTSGSYVLARKGISNLYHHPQCVVVGRNGLKPSPLAELDEKAVPCDECHPEDFDNLVLICAEVPRPWATVSDSAEGVVDHLTKEDFTGSRYLTRVAQRLLEEAGKEDPAIDAAYRVEYIK